MLGHVHMSHVLTTSVTTVSAHERGEWSAPSFHFFSVVCGVWRVECSPKPCDADGPTATAHANHTHRGTAPVTLRFFLRFLLAPRHAGGDARRVATLTRASTQSRRARDLTERPKTSSGTSRGPAPAPTCRRRAATAASVADAPSAPRAWRRCCRRRAGAPSRASSASFPGRQPVNAET